MTFWGCVASRDKKATASLRTMFNRISKRINKEKGISEKACTVKNGEIVEVTPRVKKGATGGGEGGVKVRVLTLNQLKMRQARPAIALLSKS